LCICCKFACFYILIFHILIQPDGSLAKNETMLLLVLYKNVSCVLTFIFIGWIQTSTTGWVMWKWSFCFKMANGHSILRCTAEILMTTNGNSFFIFNVEYKKSKINSAIVRFWKHFFFLCFLCCCIVPYETEWLRIATFIWMSVCPFSLNYFQSKVQM